jgi:hypothetical protein
MQSLTLSHTHTHTHTCIFIMVSSPFFTFCLFQFDGISVDLCGQGDMEFKKKQREEAKREAQMRDELKGKKKKK